MRSHSKYPIQKVRSTRVLHICRLRTGRFYLTWAWKKVNLIFLGQVFFKRSLNPEPDSGQPKITWVTWIDLKSGGTLHNIVKWVSVYFIIYEFKQGTVKQDIFSLFNFLFTSINLKN